MKKILMIIGAIVVGIIVLGVVIFLIVSATSEKLICKSSNGNITIMYNDKTLTGYTTAGSISYDFDGQKDYAESTGVKKYIEEFTAWYADNTDGTCEQK